MMTPIKSLIIKSLLIIDNLSRTKNLQKIYSTMLFLNRTWDLQINEQKMRVLVCIFMYLYVIVCIFMYLYVIVCICNYLYVIVWICMYLYVIIRICMYFYVIVCICMYLYIHNNTLVHLEVGWCGSEIYIKFVSL